MSTNHEPEPLDEAGAAPVETRGGDHLEDIVLPGPYLTGGCGHLGADCECGAE